MRSRMILKKRKSILFRIFTVILALTISTILFIIAFWQIFSGKLNPVFAHVHLAITLIILVAAGFLVASFVIRKILKPLSLLNNAVEEIGKGNLEQRISIDSDDEFGSLANAINFMTADLKKMIEARDQLLLSVSHELRTPITRARIALEMIPDSSEKKSVEGDLKEMEHMITGILESERLKNGSIKLNLSHVKVAELLPDVLNGYRTEKERIVLYPVSDELKIYADQTLIRTVLRNLIDNSLKYSAISDKSIEISVIHRGEDIIIQIEDYGQGIPSDKLPFIFEPFFRVDESRSKKTGGYGLGLHLCKQIMDLHEAQIEVKNKPDSSGIIASLFFRVDSVE
jgi:signal transduction histidine kinase